MTSLSSTSKDLSYRWNALQLQWQTTCGLWNDPVRHQFEREFWQEWEQVVPATMEAMQQLAAVVSAAKRAVH